MSDMVGRLKPGITIEQAQAGMNTLAAATRTVLPGDESGADGCALSGQ
ncbi:MAG: hypothetical protein WKF84_09820 [Pyrinomonadaceae bacterium]